ncbi:MAG: zinc-ribbon domain-containing protein [Halodesulfurarchaeum sp.]
MGDWVCYLQFCPSCDAEVAPDDEECPDCGASLSDD